MRGKKIITFVMALALIFSIVVPINVKAETLSELNVEFSQISPQEPGELIEILGKLNNTTSRVDYSYYVKEIDGQYKSIELTNGNAIWKPEKKGDYIIKVEAICDGKTYTTLKTYEITEERTAIIKNIEVAENERVRHTLYVEVLIPKEYQQDFYQISFEDKGYNLQLWEAFYNTYETSYSDEVVSGSNGYYKRRFAIPIHPVANTSRKDVYKLNLYNVSKKRMEDTKEKYIEFNTLVVSHVSLSETGVGIVGVPIDITFDGGFDDDERKYTFRAANLEDNKFEVIKEGINDNKCTFIPKKSGRYVISVTSNGKTGSMTDEKVIFVGERAIIDKIEVNKEKIVSGEEVLISVRQDSTNGVVYTYEINDGTETKIIKEDTPEKEINYIFEKPGDYEIKVKGKVNGGQALTNEKYLYIKVEEGTLNSMSTLNVRNFYLDDLGRSIKLDVDKKCKYELWTTDTTGPVLFASGESYTSEGKEQINIYNLNLAFQGMAGIWKGTLKLKALESNNMYDYSKEIILNAEYEPPIILRYNSEGSSVASGVEDKNYIYVGKALKLNVSNQFNKNLDKYKIYIKAPSDLDFVNLNTFRASFIPKEIGEHKVKVVDYTGKVYVEDNFIVKDIPNNNTEMKLKSFRFEDYNYNSDFYTNGVIYYNIKLEESDYLKYTTQKVKMTLTDKNGIAIENSNYGIENPSGWKVCINNNNKKLNEGEYTLKVEITNNEIKDMKPLVIERKITFKDAGINSFKLKTNKSIVKPSEAVELSAFVEMSTDKIKRDPDISSIDKVLVKDLNKYSFYVRQKGEKDYTLISKANISNSIEFTPNKAGEYEFKTVITNNSKEYSYETGTITVEYAKEDIDKNGVVDIVDLSLVASRYNEVDKDTNWNEAYDLNNDKIIDIYDLTKISRSL